MGGLCLSGECKFTGKTQNYSLEIAQIKTWVVAPYKKPLRDLPENQVFNNHVSMLRIRSEHAIGFLKGRFQSLKSLRINIRNEATHKFATYWVVACIAVHSFAMQCEADEKESDDSDDNFNMWDFIEAGLSSHESDDESESVPIPERTQMDERGLADAKLWREKLKERLFQAKDRNQRRRQRVRRHYGVVLTDSGESTNSSSAT